MNLRKTTLCLSILLLSSVALWWICMLAAIRNKDSSLHNGREPTMKSSPNEFLVHSHRIHRSNEGLPEHIQKALSAVDNLPGMFPVYEEHGIDIEETETLIIITWPSRYEGTNARRADYEVRAVVDKQTFSVVSLMRGS